MKTTRTAKNLTHGPRLDVSDCRDCGHAIAWATSASGSRYPCFVGGVEPRLFARPWQPHTSEICERNQHDEQQQIASITEADEKATAIVEFDSMVALVDRARGGVNAKLPLDKISDAAEQVARTERITTAAKMRLAKYVREADRAQIPKAEIARRAGLSRPTVYEILRRG